MLEWRVKRFAELSVNELYDFLRLRVDIFIVEQQSPYSDLDGKDTHPETRHVMGYEDGKLVAYSRLMPQGLGYPEEVLELIDTSANDVCIGRVVVATSHRGRQLGHELMKLSFDTLREIHTSSSIFISSQEHLKDYYGAYGFEVITGRYYEDGCTMLGLRYTP
ncbi:GNAT family N-acetyltransferase [Vibrio coralliilyticus]|uniref:GNAT family N-acetyltransferase n=1 Tax=Vibrio coralliilyticus TaxID=190893 RepID=UPI000BAAB22C|nr:GNAT family N-acetyltransferase [Vibrio coralliilyticus]MCC2520946.1 GNAT family N-acetyltransferase [Vibrio coralliilyticus]PAU39796.1 GNAT family N-acetyltransferase [Vibrio coralliilyticus]